MNAAESFQLAFEAAPTGMLMIDARGAIVLLNAQIENLFGYARDELIGQQFSKLIPERLHASHAECCSEFFASPRKVALGGEGAEVFGVRKDGSEIPIEIGMDPLVSANATLVLSSIVDISAHKRAEEQLRQRTTDLTNSLKERDVLLHEIHHRVKNNLQVISSLINMQARKLAHGEARHALHECKARVEAIALIHEKLYESPDMARVQFSDYVRSLAQNVLYAAGPAGKAITLRINIEEISLAVDKAIPCGLILNELLINAFQHAFPQGRAGTLQIQLNALASNRLRLLVRDDGVGIPDIHRGASKKSLGLQLVRTLTLQLDGTLSIKAEGGTSVSIEFPWPSSVV